MTKTVHRFLIPVLIFLALSFSAQAGGMYFIENRGQWESDILFRTEIPGGFLFLKNNSLVYVFYDASKVSSQHGKVPAKQTLSPTAKTSDLYSIPAHGVEVRFQNSSQVTKHTPKNPVAVQFSYFIGNDSKSWARDVKGYGEVIYENVYPGIDMRIYMHQFILKYEFIVHPQADASQIKMKYEGASGISVNETGQAVIKTSLGQFKEAEPYSFQKINNNNVEIPSKFELSEGNLFQFLLPKGYDKSQTLTIDPELIFSTYSGSVPDNWGHTATYDEEGNLYSGGTVFGTNFPVTTGAYQVRFQGLVDVAIMKFNPNGSDLIYATYLGGNNTDLPTSLIVSSKKELLILGTTSSKDFPVHTSAFQKVFGGGTGATPISGLDMPNGSDIFISKLSADGKQLTASTYLGGSGNDGISTEDNVSIINYGDSFRGEIIVDKSDNVVIVSSTNSPNFPITNSLQNKLGGRQDGVLAKFSSDLSNLLLSTYVGGNEYDATFSVKLGLNEDIYVTGITQSTNLAVHTTAFQPKLNGTEDAFIARFSADKLVGMTYLGTDKADGAYLLDMDQSGNVYVYGLSQGDYPVSSGVYSNAKSGQFIHELDATLSKSVLSTVIGSGRGTPDISPTAFLVNECGNIYIAGWGGNVNYGTGHNPASSTVGLAVTEDAIQHVTNGNNFYIAILETGAKSLLYATYFGSTSRNTNISGDHVDGGTSRFDKNGVIYHATCACGGSNFPSTPQAWSETNNSPNCNNAAFKIDIDRLKADFDVYEGTKKDVLRGCAPLSLSFVNTSEGGVDYIWEVQGNTISREETQAEYIFKIAGEYTVTLKAYNRLTCKRVDIAQKTIIVETIDATVKSDSTVCENTAVKLWASGGTAYNWTPATGFDNAQSATPTVTVSESADFTVEISNASGCKVERQVHIEVEKKTDFVDMPDTEICVGASATLSVTGSAQQFVWQATGGLPQTTGSSVTVTPSETTTYTVQGIYADGCKPLRQIIVKVDRSYEPDFEIVKSGEACNEPFKYSMMNRTANATQVEWNLGTGSLVKDPNVENYVYEEPGKYTVTLTAYNAAGCSLTVIKEVTADPAFILSNVITPNGDGKNDFFIVPVAQSSLEVYNRWGKMVYKSADYKSDWGKGIANGTYYYVVDTPNGNHCKGWLEVLE